MSPGGEFPMTTSRHTRRISVVGLGYVGLPVAVAFGRTARVVGFDVNPQRIEELRAGHDRTGEVVRRRPGRRRHPLHGPHRGPAHGRLPHRRRADARRRRPPARPDAAREGLRVRRPRAEEGRHRRLRVHGLPRRHRGRLRPGARARLGPALAASTSRSATAPSASTPATRSTPSRRSRRSSPARTPRRWRPWPPSTARSSPPACTAPRRSRWPRPPRSSRTPSAT